MPVTASHGDFGFDMNPSDRAKFEEVWKVHQNADWPGDLGSNEGQLMTLDTVIGGCLTYFCQEHDLDEQRVEILRDCLSELEGVVEDVSEPPSEYFHRLKFLGTTLLQDYS
ncbi:MAG: hypothetical protein E4H32_01910 [Nitrospirales bacterium]|nr:MAG: hypothetical protein E4H32_01910 [Nitrospirales bacterium]